MPGVTREGAAAALHNMSAPPRSVTVLRPLRCGPPARPGAGGETVAPGPTAAFFARVDLVGLLTDARAHVARGRDVALDSPSEWPDLADAIGLLRALEPGGPPLRAAQWECREWPFERLHEAFLARVSPLGVAGLPPLLLARPLSPRQRAPRRRLAPAKAIRLLAGTSGELFIRSRAPSASVFLDRRAGTSFDYYVPGAVALEGEHDHP